MKYIRSITQQRLCLMLAVYIGLFLNGAVLFRRVEGYFEDLTVRNGIFAAIEVFGSVLATFFLLRLLSLFGRRTWQILASLVVIISAAADNTYCLAVACGECWQRLSCCARLGPAIT